MKLRLRLRKISEFGQRRPLLFNFFTLQKGGTCSWSAGDSGEAKITIFNVLLCICMVPEIFTSGEDLTLRGETFTGEGQVQIRMVESGKRLQGIFVWRKIYCGCGCDSVPQPNPPSQTCELRPTLPRTHEKRPPDCSDGLVSIAISPKDRGSCGKRFRFPQGTQMLQIPAGNRKRSNLAAAPKDRGNA